MSDGAAPASGGQGGAAANAGGAATPPANAAPANNGAGANGAGTPPSWMNGFNDELKGYSELKGWKDPSQVVESYRNFEKLKGVPQERLLTLPDKDDAPEWGGIYDRLGRPKESKGYELEIPKDIGDPKFADAAKEWFHKNGISKKAGEGIVKEWNAYMTNQAKEAQANKVAKDAQADVELKRLWGAAYDQNNKIADRAVSLFGDNAKTVLKAIGDAVGVSEGMKVLHSLGMKMGEDSFVAGSSNGGGFSNVMTPGQAQATITAKMADADFRTRLLNKDAAAVREWNELNQMAKPQPD